MKKLMISTLALMFLFSSTAYVHASDWDKAGKILTVIEGLRFVSGGEIDVIGGLTDAVHGNGGKYHHKYKRRGYKKHHHHHKICKKEKYWVPEYEWKKEWIPKKQLSVVLKN